MKYKYTSSKSIIDDFLRHTYDDGSINKLNLQIYADYAIDRIIPADDFKHRIAILNIDNYKTQLPKDFKYVIQAGYKAECEDVCRERDQVIQWTQDVFNEDCELEINLKCNNCHSTSCNCDETVLEVDVDYIWESSHPEVKAKYMRHFHTYRNFTQRGGEDTTYYHPQYKLMRTTSNSFFNVPYHIDECVNLNYDTDVEYTIDENRNMIVNFKKGTVLVSYLGYVMDDEGFRMIPDNQLVFRAVRFYIESVLAFSTYKQKMDQNSRIFWQQMEEMAERLIARARSEMAMPNPDRMKQFIDNHWRKIIHYNDFESNLNRFRPDEFKYPNTTYTHGVQYRKNRPCQ